MEYQSVLRILVPYVFFQTNRISSDHVVTPACGPDADLCEFSLVVRHALTMMSEVPDDPDTHYRPLIIFPNGTCAVRMRTGCSDVKALDATAVSQVLTVDGSYKMVMTVNDQMPGPSIVVYGGQQVVVNVTNALLSEALTIHWHGQHQMGTPWMDGTGGVSHCSILPGETFTYRFVAHPSGTYWYHAHEGVQRADGVFGPFIVLPRPGSTKYKVEDEQYPKFKADYTMTVQDWYSQPAGEVYLQWDLDIGRFANYYGDLTNCYDERQNVDGYLNTYIQPHSVLINGKGWHYADNSTIPDNKGVPLEIFKVDKGQTFRFRVINAGLALTLRVSVDRHVMNVMATDGSLVKSRELQSIIVAPGERYDFWINATDPDNTGLYWIRTEGIEWTTGGKNEQVVLPVHGEALLKYTDVTLDWNQSAELPSLDERQACSDVTPCDILNCPYKYYPPESYMTCVSVTSLQPAIPEKPLITRDGGVTYDNFLHLHYAGSHPPSYHRTATIDSKMFQRPSTPPQIYPRARWSGGEGLCLHDQPCEKEFCPCTHVMKVAMGTVVQVTILVMAHMNNPNPSTHPIHMHGHSFQVVKMGYPKYDVTTGKVLSQSEDVMCSDDMEICHHPTWSNASWSSGQLPDLADDVIRKDTVAVPVGGYAVIRFETTNPGFWFLHCHMAFHAMQGMAMIIQEGEIEDMPATPNDFKTCGNFLWSDKDFRSLTNFQYGKASDPYQVDIAAQKHYHIQDSEGSIPISTYTTVQVALIVTASLLLGAILLCLALVYKLRKTRHGYAAVPGTGLFSSDESQEDLH